MIKLNNNEKLLVIITSGLLIVFMLKSFVLSPIYDKTRGYLDDIEQSKKVIRKYMALETKREGILKAQKQIESYSTLKGLDEDKVAMIMSKIESEARNTKLQILDLNSVGSSKVKGGVTLYRVALRAEGTLRNILNFISGIEGANILLDVEKLTLNQKDENSSVLRADITVLGVSFQ
jgi:hypothetical protein